MNYQDMYGCNFESENVGRASNFEFRVSLGIRDLRMGVAFRILIIYYLVCWSGIHSECGEAL